MKGKIGKRVLSVFLGVSLLSVATVVSAEEAAAVSFKEKHEVISADTNWSYNGMVVLQLKAGDVKVEAEDGKLGGAGLIAGSRSYGGQTGNFQDIAGTSNGLIVGMSGTNDEPKMATDVTFSMTVAEAGEYEIFLIYDTKDESENGTTKQAFFRIDGEEQQIPLSKEKFKTEWNLQYLADSITVELTAGEHALVLTSGAIDRTGENPIKSVNADFIVVRAAEEASEEPVSSEAVPDEPTSSEAAPDEAVSSEAVSNEAVSSEAVSDEAADVGGSDDDGGNGWVVPVVIVVVVVIAAGVAAIVLFKKKAA